MKLDRSSISIVPTDSDTEVLADYKAMTGKEKFELITYLRESFYGQEATTGRLQRVFTLIKQE